MIQTEPLRLKPSILFFFLFKAVCLHISVDNVVPIIACELQVILDGRDISIQFEIYNKKLLFACTKIITLNIFVLLK